MKCQIYPSYETVRSAKNLGRVPFQNHGNPPRGRGLNLYRFRGPDPAFEVPFVGHMVFEKQGKVEMEKIDLNTPLNNATGSCFMFWDV